MGSKARNYSDLTLKRLFGLSGNQCAFPDCSVILVQSDTDTNFSNICHIEDANEGGRYNPNMSDADRAHYNNLILLCPTHHVETNNIEKYSADILREMKRTHEAEMGRRTSADNPLAMHPSLLADVINYISSSDLPDTTNQNRFSDSYSIEEKIEFNQVIEYKPILEDYKIYQGKINNIYVEMEQQGSFKKTFLLEHIRFLYVKAKATLAISDVNSVQANADKLIKEVEESLWKIIDQSSNISSDTPIEITNFGLNVVMVDAFMRCKILEKPPI